MRSITDRSKPGDFTRAEKRELMEDYLRRQGIPVPGDIPDGMLNDAIRHLVRERREGRYAS